MLNSIQMDTLFNNLKDARMFAPIGDNRVKIRSGAMIGEWKYVGSLLVTDATDAVQLSTAEEFFYKNKKQAKQLRERIAAWRSEHLDIDPSTLEVKML